LEGEKKNKIRKEVPRHLLKSRAGNIPLKWDGGKKDAWGYLLKSGKIRVGGPRDASRQ